MDKTKNKKTGSIGEDKAAEHLRSIGYEILERNLKLFCGEIDILARDKKTIVIVEVKTVRGEGFGPAQDLVRYKKRQKLLLLAKAVEQKYTNKAIRIDVIGIDYSGIDLKITHLVSAVEC